MRKLRGTRFDPDMIDVFLEVLPAIHQIARRYEEKE